MHRSSESIGSLAAALAKAQSELTNPEKLLTAIIGPQRAGEGDRSFRYAPLASGLEIVRKALGHHEIATVQTTAIDVATGMVNLTTVLAHASGEWIASDWPVCPMTETAAPRRMGAALTYARRYALFTLVGIAGEDDLDAPDLNSPATQTAVTAEAARRTGDSASNPPLAGDRRSSSNGRRPIEPILAPDSSAGLRDRLLAEISVIGSDDAAATWAYGTLAVKSRLTGSDAHLVEDAFANRLTVINSETGVPADGNGPGIAVDGSEPSVKLDGQTAIGEPAGSNGAPPKADPAPPPVRRIDKSALSFGEPRRYRNPEHLKLVASQPCVVCGRQPSDPHHVRFGQKRALGRKVSDEFTVPVCRTHHRELHRSGSEFRWWEAVGIDPLKIARKLWKKTRLDGHCHGPRESSPGAASSLGKAPKIEVREDAS